MARLARLTVNHFRGIRKLTLNLDGKNVALIGPNGSGKSSVADAVDFLLTGEIRRLTGEGAGSLSLPKHGPHVDAGAQDAWVEGEFVSSSRARVVLRREVANAGVLKRSGDVPADVARFVELAARGAHHMLTRREILRYIFTEPGKRNEQVASLLQLTRIESMRKEVQGAARQAKDALSNAVAVRDTHHRAVLRSVTPAAGTRDEALARANAHRARFGGAPLATLEATGIRRDLAAPAVATIHPLQAQRTRDLLVQLGTWFEATVAGVAERTDRFLTRVAELHADTDALKSLRASDLLERGLRLVAGDECPLCLREWEAGELRALIASRIEAAREANVQLQELRRERDAIRGALTDGTTTARSLVDALAGRDDCDAAPLAKYIEDVKLAASTLLIDPISGTLPSGDSRAAALAMLGGAPARACIEAFRRRAVDMPTLESVQQFWDELVGLEKALKEHEAALVRHALAERLAKELDAADKMFVGARDEVLESTYDAIAGRLAALYSKVHRDDEAQFQASLSPTKAGLKLEVDFYGRGEFPPCALHSEGHQDSMGLCLFLTLTEHLAQGRMPVLVLDDVLMSVDREHRRAVAELLRDEYRDCQLILTTHDRVWWRQLRSLGVVAGRGAIEIKKWSLEGGPVLTVDAGEMLGEARAELAANRVPQAAHALRRAVEAYFPDICDALGARLRFRGDGEWGAGEFVSAAVGRYNELFKEARRAGLSWGDEAAEWDERDRVRREAFGERDAENWAVNVNIHFNEWAADFTAADFAPVLAAYEKMFSLFVCDRCSGVLEITEDGPSVTGVRCRCMRTNWNLLHRRETERDPARSASVGRQARG